MTQVSQILLYLRKCLKKTDIQIFHNDIQIEYHEVIK